MNEDILKRVVDYRNRAKLYLKNFEKEKVEGNKEKAGEALWGVISCLINALALFEYGKPIPDHKEQSKFATQFILSTYEDGEELAKAYRNAEKFHANFYHAFLDDKEFETISAEILDLAGRLDATLVEKLRKL
ncbi:MAG: hypothetical protein QXR89_06305 [Candidatus Bathyarchaeia archaeon]